MLRAGQLTERITIRRRGTPTRDGYGAEVASIVDVATVWAQRVDMTGREYLAAGERQAQRVIRYLVRKRTDVLPTDFIVDGARTVQINAVLERAPDALELVCEDFNGAL